VVVHGAVANHQIDGIKVPAWLCRCSMRHFRSESYDRIDDVAAKITNLPPRRPPRS
jgi:hypothetical protein